MNLTNKPRLMLWQDQAGVVVSTELVTIATTCLIGLLVAMSSVRDSVISEISDVAGAAQDFKQAYSFNTLAGHSGQTHGSAFDDASDFCDDADDASGTADNCITMDAPPSNEEDPVESVTATFDGEGPGVTATVGASVGNAWLLWSNGEIFFKYVTPADGNYTFSARLWQSAGGPNPANAEFSVNGVAIDNFDVTPTSFGTAQEYSVDVFLPAGSHMFSVGFTNDFFAPPIDRNLFIDYMQVTGPN